MKKNNPVGAIYLLPFITLISISGLSFLQSSSNFNTQIEDSGISIKVLLLLSYCLAFFLVTKRRAIFYYFVIHSYPLILMILYILCTWIWSSFPGAVFLSFAHQLGAMFIAMATTILLSNNPSKFFKLTLTLLFFYLLSCIFVSLFFPSIGLMPNTPGMIGSQWRGLTLHYNTLGTLCLISIWIATSSYFLIKDKNKSTYIKIICVVFLAFICLYKSNSMTSTLVSIALFLSVFWFSLITTSPNNSKSIKIIFIYLYTSLILISIIIINPEFLTAKYFFKLIGRNESLTGRTTLWELGWQGILERPYFGWSFDSLRSFFEHHSLGYGQLHNGYLDLLLRGGLVSIIIFMLMVFQVLKNTRKIKLSGDKRYFFILSLLIAILIHNITEASIFRNTHPLWLMFLIAYFYSFSCIFQYKLNSINNIPYKSN